MNVWQAGLLEPLTKFLQDPKDVPAIQRIYECYSKDERVLEAIGAKLLADDRFRALYESWYTPEPFTLEQLLKLPPNTFGHIYAAHMKKNGLDPNFISPFEGKNILSYLWQRAGHVHDIIHILTGYDTSYMGELALKGVELAQNQSPASAGVLGGGLLAATSQQPQLVGPMLDKIIEGYLYGKRCPVLMGIKWDQEWETPLAELRRKYDIPPTPFFEQEERH